MNSYVAGGLGAGLALASQNIQKGLLQAYNIKNRRELQAREQAMQDAQFNQTSQLNDLRLQELQLQVKQLQDNLAKKETYEAFDAYEATKDPKYLNDLLKNPKISSLMNGTIRMDRIDVNSEQDRQLLKKYIGTDELDDIDTSRWIKTTRADGTVDIVDIYGAYAKTGYINRMRKDSIDKIRLEQAKLQARMQELQTKQQEIKVESAEKWLRDNPDKTYRDYLLGQQRQKLVTNASLKDEYATLKVKESSGKLSDDEKTRLKVLTKLFSTDSDEKRRILEKGIKITEKYRGKLFESDVSDDDVITAKLYAEQAGIKPDSKDAREFKDKFNTLRQGKRLEKEIMSLGDEEIARGIVDTGIQKLKTYMADGKKPDDKMLKSIQMQTKLGKFLAAYIKSISGTAVAEKEFERLQELLGGDNWTNTATLKEALKTFVGELDKEFKDMAETSLLDNPATTLDLVSRYKKFTKELGDDKQIKEYVINPKTKKPTEHYVGEVIEYQGKKYKIINAAGDLEELK